MGGPVVSGGGGAVYYTVNGGIASENSGGFVPADAAQRIGPIANLTGIRIYSASGTAHVQYWREA